MLNINKVRKAQQGQLFNSEGLKSTQISIPTTLNTTLEIQGLKTNPYMKSNSNPTLVNQNLYNTLGQGMDFMGNIFSLDQNGYQGTYGSWKEAGNQIYNQISNQVSSFNPAFGLGLKGLGFVNNLTPGTDAMTKQDAIIDNIPILKQINSGFGKKTKDLNINQDTLAQVGGDFTGSTKDILNAKDKANKKYGLFSNRARQKANSQIQDAQNQQNKMTEIANESRDLQSIASNMSDLNSLNYLQKINGGIDFRYTRAAKSGTKLSRIKKLQLHKIGGIINQSINVDTKEIEDTWVPTITLCESFENGGKTEEKNLDDITFETWYNSIPENKKDTTNYNLRRAFELAPQKELIDFINNPDSHLRTFYYNSEGIGEFMKSKNHPTLWMELEYYNNGNQVINKNGENIIVPANKKEWENFRNNYDLDTTGEYYKYIPKKFKNGGKTISKEEESSQKNVIPEGALHKNKHHMENAENLTQKGIPVIDNEGEQQAEIEREEILFTLEVTKKLEELYDKYNSTKDDKYAIEAGKLLVEQILFNTEDRTGLINTLQQGGKINEVS